jgi:hypothetical protein
MCDLINLAEYRRQKFRMTQEELTTRIGCLNRSLDRIKLQCFQLKYGHKPVQEQYVLWQMLNVSAIHPGDIDQYL